MRDWENEAYQSNKLAYNVLEVVIGFIVFIPAIALGVKRTLDGEILTVLLLFLLTAPFCVVAVYIVGEELPKLHGKILKKKHHNSVENSVSKSNTGEEAE